nr:MAG TPA: hypothetical protein [Caudoviricetes sp.]
MLFYLSNNPKRIIFAPSINRYQTNINEIFYSWSTNII